MAKRARSTSTRPSHPVARPAAGRSALRGAAGRGAATMPFDRINYTLLLAACGVIVLGYVLMVIDNATNDNPVDSVLSLYVAPLLLLAGYLGMAGAVLWGAPGDASPADASPADDAAAPAVPTDA